jgi:periplasmic glucans biosynthesis protein
MFALFGTILPRPVFSFRMGIPFESSGKMQTSETLLSRRHVMGGLAASLSMMHPGAVMARPSARAESATRNTEPFSRDTVVDQARTLASQPFQPLAALPAGLQDLDYSTYRRICYRKDEAIWGQAPTPFSIELFAPGSLYKHGVDVFIVENGQSRAIAVGPESFETPTAEIGALISEVAQFAGFRLHYPLNRADYRDEFIVFQGASYLRAVSRGQTYGLSARGLAIDVAEPTGEEFPTFRRFWIERPSSRANAIVVHALLDSPRVAGAYRFGIYPGAPTTIDVDATLIPRAPLTHIGLGTLTSMFMHGAIDPPDRPDYRPAVHDSLGLAMVTRQGERLWRPLGNPAALQVSAFVDENPKGFGLIQRDREFSQFQDLEARYDMRPSAWISPRGDWGPGFVQLVEIPSPFEGNDNIVAYWRPNRRLEAGVAFPFAYRLTWPNDYPPPQDVAPVSRSAFGLALANGKQEYVVDYGAAPGIAAGEVTAHVSVSTGRVLEVRIQPNPLTGGFRVFVTFDPGGAPLCEIRLQPLMNGTPVGETWLNRWLRS